MTTASETGAQEKGKSKTQDMCGPRLPEGVWGAETLVPTGVGCPVSKFLLEAILPPMLRRRSDAHQSGEGLAFAGDGLCRIARITWWSPRLDLPDPYI